MLKPSVLPLLLCCWLCAGRGRSVKDYHHPPHGQDGDIPGLLDTTARPGHGATHRPSDITITDLDYIDVVTQPGYQGDACLARIECQPYRVPKGRGFHLLSVSLYHVIGSDVSGTLLARADRRTDMKFTDHHQLSHGGVAADLNRPVCVGHSNCNGTAAYYISPMQAEDLGEYRCEVLLTNGHQAYRYVGSRTLKFDRCCKPCSYCDDKVGGVWGHLSRWYPRQCTGCLQWRMPVGCATRQACKGTPPRQCRTCPMWDGVCDETDKIKVITEKVGDQCRARIQCKVTGICDVHSVKLYHLVERIIDTYKVTYGSEIRYNTTALLAKAIVGVNGGRFHEVAKHPNGGVSPNVPSDPRLCRGTDNCRQYYTYTFDTMNEGNMGDYACVVTGSDGQDNDGLRWPAKLDFGRDCPKPTEEDLRVQDCVAKCLEKYLVPGFSENYIRFYCHRVCDKDSTK